MQNKFTSVNPAMIQGKKTNLEETEWTINATDCLSIEYVPSIRCIFRGEKKQSNNRDSVISGKDLLFNQNCI